MIDHEIPYEPESSSISKYDYKYLRLQAMYYCEVNWKQGEELPNQILCFLERKADEYSIDGVDLKDCMGAVYYQVCSGFDLFQSTLVRYKEPFLAEAKNIHY